jgi:molybdenum cofactor cytidylyltransferase
VGVNTGASIVAAILAAGAARRMGVLKQLLPFGEGTLLSHAINEACSANFDHVLVVLGADAVEIQTKLEGLAGLRQTSAAFIQNDRWETGIASSVQAAVNHVQAIQTIRPKGVAILLADQPKITATHLQRMREIFLGSGADVIAAQYAGALGVPAIFSERVFNKLLTLTGDRGARQLLQDPSLTVLPFPLPEAAIDIDTPDDFSQLTRR